MTALLDRKFEAVLAHDTQISADSWFRTLPPDLRDEAFGYETFVLVVSQVEAAADAPDLFAGLR